MAITHPTGWPIAANGDTLSLVANITSYTMPAAYGNVGDLALVWVLTGSDSTYPSMVTSTKTTTAAPSNEWYTFASYRDTTNGLEIFALGANVSSTSGADTLTITYAGSFANYCDIWPDSLTAGFGAATQWSVTNGVGTTGVGTAIGYESLTAPSTPNPMAYEAFAAVANEAEGTNGGGFTFIDSTTSGNELVFDLSVTSGNPYAPTSTQPAGGFWTTVGCIIEASLPAPSYILPPPMILMQAPQRASFR